MQSYTITDEHNSPNNFRYEVIPARLSGEGSKNKAEIGKNLWYVYTFLALT
jgi:hypothetical protein